jgi:replicative DNA helicase
MTTDVYKPGLKSEKEQLDLEEALLGSILLGGGVPEEIMPTMFFFSKNQVIFMAIKELKKICEPNLNILINHLKEAGELDKAGGAAYIAGLTNLILSTCNIDYYVNELTESYYRRSVNSVLTTTQEELVQGKSLDEIIECLPQDIQEISSKRNQKKWKVKRGISFNDLIKKQFPLAIWIVENLITAGLTVLTGGSKIGKSWLALQLAIAIDRGDYFLGDLPTKKLGIVYFALEDTEERIKRRLTKYGIEEFNDAWLETTWKHGLTSLKTFLQENPQFKVVIIDTLQKFARITDIKDYTETVTALSTLKQIADELGIAIIAIHHTRKGAENGVGDWMDGGLGSVGINATADCSITLTRKRDSAEGFLRATGRDIEDIHWALRWDKESCTWSRIGEAPKEKLLSEDQHILLQILEEESPNPVSTAVIAEKVGKSLGNTINILNRLVTSGFVTKAGRGLWAVSDFTHSLSIKDSE